MRDKYNLNTMPAGSALDPDDIAGEDTNQIPMIPGMAPEDRVENIPGVSGDFTRVPPPISRHEEDNRKKTPYSKPIPKNFQNSWNDVQVPPVQAPVQAPMQESIPSGCLSLQELQRQATAVVAFGNVYPVLPGSNLFMSINKGEMAVKDCLRNELIL